jgi:hypothetical protein
MNVIFSRANLDQVNPVLDCDSTERFAQFCFDCWFNQPARLSLVPNIR